MFRLVIAVLVLYSGIATAAPDMVGLKSSITKISAAMKKENFQDRFKYIDPILKAIDKERKKINDSNFEQQEGNLFELNFLYDSISELKRPFQKKECDFKRRKLISNFSDYKTGKIHKKLQKIAQTPISVIDQICIN